LKLSRLLAWGVHLYTATGLLAAAGMAVLIVRGGPADYAWAFALMVAASLVDSTDGLLARRMRVKETLPEFDGRRLDDITDFLTYTALPLFLVWRTGLVADGWEWCLLAVLLASAYGFCQTEAKTADGYFVGFPSYWNVVAFYLYVLRPNPWAALGLVLLLAALTFVPTRYLYPTQPGKLNRCTCWLGAAWTVMLAVAVYHLVAAAEALVSIEQREQQRQAEEWAAASLFFPAWYMGASWWISLRHWMRRGQMR